MSLRRERGWVVSKEEVKGRDESKKAGRKGGG